MKLFLIIQLLLLGSKSRKLERQVTIDTFQSIYCNKEYVICEISWAKINRHTRVLNINITTLRELSNDLVIELKFLKLSDNLYKPTAIYYKRNFCDYLNVEYKMVLSRNNLSHFYTECPVTKGFYYVRNLVPVVHVPYLPLWHFRMYQRVVDDPRNITVQSFNVDFSVTDV